MTTHPGSPPVPQPPSPPDPKPYRRRPIDVVAFRWDGGPVEGYGRVYDGYGSDGEPALALVVNPFVQPAYARVGDWIVTTDGVDSVVTPEDFARDYEAAGPG